MSLFVMRLTIEGLGNPRLRNSHMTHTGAVSVLSIYGACHCHSKGCM